MASVTRFGRSVAGLAARNANKSQAVAFKASHSTLAKPTNFFDKKQILTPTFVRGIHTGIALKNEEAAKVEDAVAEEEKPDLEYPAKILGLFTVASLSNLYIIDEETHVVIAFGAAVYFIYHSSKDIVTNMLVDRANEIEKEFRDAAEFKKSSINAQIAAYEDQLELNADFRSLISALKQKREDQVLQEINSLKIAKHKEIKAVLDKMVVDQSNFFTSMVDVLSAETASGLRAQAQSRMLYNQAKAEVTGSVSADKVDVDEMNEVIATLKSV